MSAAHLLGFLSYRNRGILAELFGRGGDFPTTSLAHKLRVRLAAIAPASEWGSDKVLLAGRAITISSLLLLRNPQSFYPTVNTPFNPLQPVASLRYGLGNCQLETCFHCFQWSTPSVFQVFYFLSAFNNTLAFEPPADRRSTSLTIMKSAKSATADASSNRRSQPARQARTNPSRATANAARNAARDPAGQNVDQSIDIFPAVTHFADAMVSLPKDLVRHFTLLKEVDAKLFTPEEQLFQLANAAVNAPLPETRPSAETSSSVAPASTPMSTQNSTAGAPPNAPSADDSIVASSSVFEPSNYPRRQLFRQTAYKIQEMLVSLEEKNHVLSTANDALQRQLARIEDVWPHLEHEFSDEAKWGSTTHWAYPENRSGKHPERARRDGAAAISAAAQALADEAAARSDARKQAVQAKKGLKNAHDTEVDNHDTPRTGKGQGKGRKVAESHVGLGISGTDPPSKKRKVEKVTNGGVAMERSMSSAMSYATAKAKGRSPTPAPEGPKKRKALPSGSGQSKKKYVGPFLTCNATTDISL